MNSINYDRCGEGGGYLVVSLTILWVQRALRTAILSI